MLHELLSEIQSGGTLEPGILADHLGTTPEMVMLMLEHLERLGKLRALPSCHSQACEGCNLSALCLPKNDRGKVWQLNNAH
jgi:FeoC like transcriptional regulator